MEFSHTINESGINVITAKRFCGYGLGRLTYYFESPPDNFRLNSVSVDEDYQGRGIGTSLVKEFARTIGANRRISSGITNEETFAYLYETGFFTEARLHPELTLIGTLPVFHHLPIIKTYGKAGIEIDSLTITNGARIDSDAEIAKKLLEEHKRKHGYFYGLFWIEFRGRTKS